MTTRKRFWVFGGQVVTSLLITDFRLAADNEPEASEFSASQPWSLSLGGSKMRKEVEVSTPWRWFALALLAAATIGASSAQAGVQSGQVGEGSFTPLAAQSGAASDCATDTTLCLGGGRFLVQATWTTPDGESGAAHAVAITATDAGYFWFFDPNNVEVAVKALNACSYDGHFWIFSAGLTNLAVSMTVFDTATNQSKTYDNPRGTPFKTILDTTSFADCPAGTVALAIGDPEEPREIATGVNLTPARAMALRDSGAGCVGSDTVLCLSGRFQVDSSWQTASGRSGVGHAVNLTAESGYFWFFDPSNVEVVVKALDACAIGSGQWFFASGMTNVGVQLSITDTFTGDVKTYGNAPNGRTPGIAFVPILDTAAFSSCRTGPPQFPTVTIASQSNPCNFPAGGATDNTAWTFVPPEIHIHVGDTVTWTQDTGTHAVASGVPGSPDGMWYLGVFTGPSSTPLTFTQSGRFPYYCVTGHAVYTVGQDGSCGSASVDHEVGIVIVDP
jgi:hypothetical protein